MPEEFEENDVSSVFCKPEERTVYAHPELRLFATLGRQMIAWYCGFKPDSGNPTVRDYRGALGNTAKEEIGTRSTIERVETVTLFLKCSAPRLYPDHHH